MKLPIILLAAAFGTSSCEPTPSSERAANQQTEALMAEAQSQLGLPAIVNFQEKRLMKMLYELRDKPDLRTYTYLATLDGKVGDKVCDSVGYGIPYATQYTNPERFVGRYGDAGLLTLPQPEPNGLFMPSDASGTWVICSHEGQLAPLFVEPLVIVSTFALK